MKSRMLLLSAIVASVAGLGASVSAFSSETDAQAQAAALLSRSHASVRQNISSSQSNAPDAHAHAAALLSGRRSAYEAVSSVPANASSAARASLDVHAQAAALIRGSRNPVDEIAKTSAVREQLNEHPAVVVARSWDTHELDPNTFIVMHPAGLQLVATSRREVAF